MNKKTGRKISKTNPQYDQKKSPKIYKKLDEIIFWGIVFVLVILFAIVLTILILVFGGDYLNF